MPLGASKTKKAEENEEFSHFLGVSQGDLGYFKGQSGNVLGESAEEAQR